MALEQIWSMVGGGPSIPNAEAYTVALPHEFPPVRLVLAPGAEGRIEATVPSAWPFLWAGILGKWSHSNWTVQLFDADQQPMQSRPALGELVFRAQGLGRVITPWLTVPNGYSVYGIVKNIDGAASLTLDCLFTGLRLGRG